MQEQVVADKRAGDDGDDESQGGESASGRAVGPPERGRALGRAAVRHRGGAGREQRGPTTHHFRGAGTVTRDFFMRTNKKYTV